MLLAGTAKAARSALISHAAMDQRSATILYVDTGPWFGGAQRSMATLINALEWQKWRPLAVAADDSPSGLLYECRFHRIPHSHVRFRHWPRHPVGLAAFLHDTLRLRLSYQQLCRSKRIDLVHANTARAGILAALALPRALPLVVHDRDIRIPRMARRLLERRAAMIIALSKTVAANWNSRCQADIEVVPNGFDVAALQEVPPSSRLALLGGTFTVLQVADLVPWKRHGLFVETMERVCAHIPGARGVILGRSLTPKAATYLAALRQQVESRGLQDCIEFVTDCENAVPWIAAADVLVNPADREPFGRCVVEALAVGTPVVVTPGGGPEEIVANAGTAGTVAAADPDSLAEAVEQRRCPVNRIAVYYDAIRCAQAYDIHRIVPRIEEIYQRVLSTRQNPSKRARIRSGDKAESCS